MKTLVACLCLLLPGPGAVQGGEPAVDPVEASSVEIFPRTVTLEGLRASRTILVTGHSPHGLARDLTRLATCTSARPAVAIVRDGVIRPVANGRTTVTVRVGTQQALIPVTVSGQERDNGISFRDETLAVLARQGCSSGTCHGSPSGKGGFRLSLRGFDPTLDEVTLLREAYGRRTNPVSPAKSLVLLKPTLVVAHGGGQRLNPSGSEYRILRDWIAEGCRTGAPSSAPDRVEVYPAKRILRLQDGHQPLVVLAHMQDGSVREVTGLCAFSSTDAAVASVDAAGRVSAHRKGDVAVLARYLDFTARALLTFVPDTVVQNRTVHGGTPAASCSIDRLVTARLARLDLAPAPMCPDDEFIRRVSLDVVGRLPTPAEVRQFLDDARPLKRSRLIDELLARPGFAAHWALKWSDVLRVSNAKLTRRGARAFHRWLLGAMRDDMAYDRFVRELLTATGSTFENPPANYFRAAATPEDCAESTAQLFLGARIQCAKCHNHPYEDWSQDEYYGLAAFFARIERSGSKVPGEMLIKVTGKGDVKQPRTGIQMPPTLPSGEAVTVNGEEDRREALVEWLLDVASEDFARVAVNRIWATLMGRGLVDPPDDFRLSNPPSHPELLDALARDFVASGYSQKHMIRVILDSRTYQASSKTTPSNERGSKRYFSHFAARLLGAEQILDAVCDVTGTSPGLAGLKPRERAVQLASPDLRNPFLSTFGQPRRDTTCECERAGEPNLSRALLMVNGSLIRGKISDPRGRLARALAVRDRVTDTEIVTALFYRAFSRPPTGSEMKSLCDHVRSFGQNDRDRRQGLEDVFWAVLNSREFLFQH